MTKIIELAKMLAEAIKQSEEVTQYKKTRETIKTQTSALVMYEDFQKKQWELQNKQMSGEKVTESDLNELQKVFDIIKINPYVNDLLLAEGKLLQMVVELQDIINGSIADIIPKNDAKDEVAEEAIPTP